MKNRLLLIFLILFIFPTINLSAQENDTPSSFKIKKFDKDSTSPPNISTPEQKNAVDFRFLQENNRLLLIVTVMGVTPIFLFIVLFFISKSEAHSGENIVHGSGLVLVIQATLLVVIASVTTEQLTAAIGVIGAIGGYLFGSSRQSDKKTQPKQNENQSTG